MLEVNIENIIPVTDARDALNSIVDKVSASDEMYVFTVNGKPSAVIVGVHHLEKLTGTPSGQLVASPTPTTETAAPAEIVPTAATAPAPIPTETIVPQVALTSASAPVAAPIGTVTTEPDTETIVPQIAPATTLVEPAPVVATTTSSATATAPASAIAELTATDDEDGTGNSLVTPTTTDLGATAAAPLDPQNPPAE